MTQYADPNVSEYAPTVMEVLMRRKGLFQKDMGARLKQDQSVISNILRRKIAPDDSTVKKIAEVLDLKNPELLFEIYNPLMDYVGCAS